MQWDLIIVAVEQANIEYYKLKGREASRMRGRVVVNLRSENRDVLNDLDGEDDDIPGARENPSAIGQFVNHPSRANGQYPNVGVVSFMWSDIFKSFEHTSEVGDISDECASELFDVPNVPRADGSPWFYDGTAGEIVYFPTNTGEKESRLDVGSPSGCGATTSTSTGGALIYATADLHKGDECYLDYSLQKPYPAWAKDWYEPVTLD